MFYDWSQGEAPPGLIKTVSPQKVADKTIEAIEKDKPEVNVTTGLANIVDILHAISPRFTTYVARRTGAYKFLERGVKEWRGRVALTVAAALCVAGLVGCDSGDANEEGTIPKRCGLPSPGPKVDPTRVPEQYLLDGTAIVRKVTEANDLFVVALNVPLTVNAAYGAYLDALGPPRYRLITKENEGFEAEIYLRDVQAGEPHGGPDQAAPVRRGGVRLHHGRPERDEIETWKRLGPVSSAQRTSSSDLTRRNDRDDVRHR